MVDENESGDSHPWPVAIGWGFFSALAAGIWWGVASCIVMPLVGVLLDVGVAMSMGRAESPGGLEWLFVYGCVMFGPIGAVSAAAMNDRRSTGAITVGWLVVAIPLFLWTLFATWSASAS